MPRVRYRPRRRCSPCANTWCPPPSTTRSPTATAMSTASRTRRGEWRCRRRSSPRPPLPATAPRCSSRRARMDDAMDGRTVRGGVTSHYDTVIVGGGIGGLVCGTQLAQLGKRTLIVDRSAQVGGCCSSFTQKGFTFDVAVHHISGCGRLSIVGSCLRALGIECEFVRLDPMDTIVFPSWSLPIPTRLDAFTASLAERFPRERVGIDAFFAEIVRLYRALLDERRESPTLARYEDLTFGEMLDGFFDDPRIKLGLSGQWGYLGSPPQELSAVGMCQMIVNYWRDGAYYPRGGTQAFADAIAERL